MGLIPRPPGGPLWMGEAGSVGGESGCVAGGGEERGCALRHEILLRKGGGGVPSGLSGYERKETIVMAAHGAHGWDGW